jgi:hypothetical protein
VGDICAISFCQNNGRKGCQLLGAKSGWAGYGRFSASLFLAMLPFIAKLIPQIFVRVKRKIDAIQGFAKEGGKPPPLPLLTKKGS